MTLTASPPQTRPADPVATATVVDVWPETERAKTFRLALERPSPFLAGQHFVVRLTAPTATGPSGPTRWPPRPAPAPQIDLTVELLDDGEVSGYLHEVVGPGDRLEVRGPIGGWFVWAGDAPALLVGGGSGIVP